MGKPKYAVVCSQGREDCSAFAHLPEEKIRNNNIFNSLQFLWGKKKGKYAYLLPK